MVDAYGVVPKIGRKTIREIIEHIVSTRLGRPLSQPAMDYLRKHRPRKEDERGRSASP